MDKYHAPSPLWSVSFEIAPEHSLSPAFLCWKTFKKKLSHKEICLITTDNGNPHSFGHIIKRENYSVLWQQENWEEGQRETKRDVSFSSWHEDKSVSELIRSTWEGRLRTDMMTNVTWHRLKEKRNIQGRLLLIKDVKSFVTICFWYKEYVTHRPFWIIVCKIWFTWRSKLFWTEKAEI